MTRLVSTPERRDRSSSIRSPIPGARFQTESLSKSSDRLEGSLEGIEGKFEHINSKIAQFPVYGTARVAPDGDEQVNFKLQDLFDIRGVVGSDRRPVPRRRRPLHEVSDSHHQVEPTQGIDDLYRRGSHGRYPL